MLRFAVILKWDRNQPRGPKGSATGGQWVKGVSGGTQGENAAPSILQRYHAQQTAELATTQAGGASYASILNAPTGTGFNNIPRLSTPLQEMMAERDTAPNETNRQAVADILSSARADLVEPLGEEGVNVSMLVTLDDDKATQGVYKPELGERWGTGFWNSDIDTAITNRKFSLAEREAFAFEVDQALKLGLVPPTVLRTKFDAPWEAQDQDDAYDEDDDDNFQYDEDELERMYQSYREKQQERVMDAVSEEMGELYGDAQKEHAEDIKNRAEEMAEIWNEAVKDFPDPPAGTQSALREHPTLPLGSQRFSRRDPGVLDPMEVLDEANVDVTYKLSPEERKRVEAVLRKRLAEGYQELGDVDDDAARGHLEYDDFIEAHQDTENKLYEDKIRSYSDWKMDQGYGSNDVGRGGGSGKRAKNLQAPHPEGGSIQHYIDGLKSWHSGKGTFADNTKLAVLDYAIGSMDRHGNNIKVSADGKLVAIDNGYSMPRAEHVTYRSAPVVDWRADTRSKQIPESVRTNISRQLESTDWQALVARHPNMGKEEREAFLNRVIQLKKAMKTPGGLVELWSYADLME